MIVSPRASVRYASVRSYYGAVKRDKVPLQTSDVQSSTGGRHENRGGEGCEVIIYRYKGGGAQGAKSNIILYTLSPHTM